MEHGRTGMGGVGEGRVAMMGLGEEVEEEDGLGCSLLEFEH